jgi:hypothetical protein
MALANIAWVLASNGRRVLVIDWDLEAPGLHRYFAPFLLDPRLEFSEGLIDFFVNYAEAATKESGGAGDANWFVPYSNLLQYANSLDWQFSGDGTIDFVPAGRQNGGYSSRVSSFDWRRFYEQFDGGLFLETVKERLREEYDYILIDSRTGVSDTSGICTVQMPDQLVACFTYNMQSLAGTAAVASSIFESRRGSSGEHTIDIWPIPMRVELAEQDRLERVRRASYERLSPLLWRLSPQEIDSYWDAVEVMHYAYYSYEEVLATFADSPGRSNSLLSTIERITAYLTGGEITRLSPPSEERRRNVLGKYLRQITDWGVSIQT